jgi:hypothetical protein
VRRNPAFVLAEIGRALALNPSLHSFSAPVLRAVLRALLRRRRRRREEEEEDAVAPAPKFSILAALLYRVHVATRLASVPARRGAGSYWLQLFIDTHIDLALAMREGDAPGFFDDEHLEDPLCNPCSLSESVFSTNAPHDTRCTYAGMLPDVSPCLQYASVWYHSDGRLYADTVMEALVRLIACKTQAHKCKVRNLPQILYEYVCSHPQLMTILRGLVVVSLLGNYPHAEVRPDFETRLHITYSLRTSVTPDTALFLWIADNEAIIYATLKEFYRYTVSLRPGFEVVLLATTYWKTVSRAIGYGMDRVRAVLVFAAGGPGAVRVGAAGPPTVSGLARRSRSPAGAGAGDPYAYAATACEGTRRIGAGELVGGDAGLHRAAMLSAADELKRLHEHAELPMVHKLRKGAFTDALVAEMTHFFATHILNEHTVRPQSSLTELARDIGADCAERVLRAMQMVIAARVPRYRTREPLELGWLTAFGVTPAGVAALRALAYDFEMKDIADNGMTQRVEALFERSTRDFFTVHVYFTLVHDWRATQSFALPDNYTESQAAALRCRWKVMPWEPLPSAAVFFHYCPACERWLADTVDASAPESAEKMHSIGTRKALYSMDTGRMHCGLQKVPVNTRKQVESGRYDDLDAHVACAAEAKRIRNFLQTPSCASTPAVTVRMLGRVQRLGGHLWALCMVCASLCPWDAHRFGPSGFTCGFHGDDAPVVLTVRQEDSAIARARARRRRDIDARCSYCGDQLRSSCDYTCISVVDDTGTEHEGNAPGEKKKKKKTTKKREGGGGGGAAAAPTYSYMRYILCVPCGKAIWSPEGLRLRSRTDAVIKRVRESNLLREGGFVRPWRSARPR